MKLLTALLLGTALASTSALAQTNTNTNAQPGAAGTHSTTGMPHGTTAGAANPLYLTQNDPNLWRASQLAGVEIYNDRNEEIGEINDVLIDRSGDVKAVVIGVGGFLGMGERNVAVSFDRLQWQVQANDTVAGAANTGMTGARNTAAGTTTGTAGTTGAAGTTTGAAGTAGSATTPGGATTGMAPSATTGTARTTGAGTAQPNDVARNNANRDMTENRDAPRRAILANATKAELEKAPEFKYAD